MCYGQVSFGMFQEANNVMTFHWVGLGNHSRADPHPVEAYNPIGWWQERWW